MQGFGRRRRHICCIKGNALRGLTACVVAIYSGGDLRFLSAFTVCGLILRGKGYSLDVVVRGHAMGAWHAVSKIIRTLLTEVPTQVSELFLADKYYVIRALAFASALVNMSR